MNLGLAQRLARKLCETCKQKTKANSGEEQIIKKAIASLPGDMQKDLPKGGFEIYKPGEGCKECGGKTYKRRIGVFETLEIDDEIEQIILGDISEAKLRAAAQRQGMLTMYQDGILKVLKGVTSLEELLQVAQAGEDTSAAEV